MPQLVDDHTPQAGGDLSVTTALHEQPDMQHGGVEGEGVRRVARGAATRVHRSPCIRRHVGWHTALPVYDDVGTARVDYLDTGEFAVEKLPLPGGDSERDQRRHGAPRIGVE